MAAYWKNILFFCLVYWAFTFYASVTYGFGGPSEQKDSATTALEGNSGSPQSSDSEGSSKNKVDPKKDPQLAYIAVKGPDFETKGSYPRAEILKVAMDEIIRTQKFELVFSSTQAFRDANYLFFELHLRGKEVHWGDNQKGFDLDYFLFNGKTGKLVTESHRERVFDRHLQYTTRVMLYEVFYGKEMAQKKAAAKKNPLEAENGTDKDNGDEKSAEANKKAADKAKADKDPNKKVEEKIEKNKKGPSIPAPNIVPPKIPPEIVIPPKKTKTAKPPQEKEEEGNKDKSSEESSNSGAPKKAGTAAAPTPPKPEDEPEKVAKPEKPEKPEIDLAESIQTEIAAHLAKLKKKKKTLEDEIKKEEEQKEDDQKKKEIEGEASKFELVAQAVQPPASPNTQSLKALKTYTMGFDVLVQQVNSTDLITVNNTFTHIGFNGTAAIHFDRKSEDALMIHLRMTQVVDSGQYSVPGMKQLGLGYLLSIPVLRFYPSAGFEYETQAFVNLNTQGGGLAVNENKLLWYKGDAEVRFNMGWRIFALLGGMARTFAGTTTYGGNGKSVNIDGSRVEVGMRLELWRGAFLELLAQKARMQSQGLSKLVNEQTTSYASVVMPL